MRLIKFLFLLIILALIGFAVYFWAMRVSFFERLLSKQLHTTVTVKNVKVSWDRLKFENLQILGSNENVFLHTDIEVVANPFSVFVMQPKTLQEVHIRNPVMRIELYNGIGSDNNWIHMIGRLPSHKGSGLRIDKLTIENLRIEVVRQRGKKVELPAINYLEFSKLGYEKSLNFQQIMRILVQAVFSSIKGRPYLSGLLDQMPPIPSSYLEGATLPPSFKEDPKGALLERLDTLKRKTEQAQEYLQGLFPRREKD